MLGQKPFRQTVQKFTDSDRGWSDFIILTGMSVLLVFTMNDRLSNTVNGLSENTYHFEDCTLISNETRHILKSYIVLL